LACANGSRQSFVTDVLIKHQQQDASLTRGGELATRRGHRLHLVYTQVTEITEFRNPPDSLVNVLLTSRAQAWRMEMRRNRTYREPAVATKGRRRSARRPFC